MDNQGNLFGTEPTFREVKQEWRDELEDGTTGLSCPCCAQHTKIYKRRIHAAVASFLIRFYRLSLEKGNWQHQVHWPWIHVQREIHEKTEGYVALDYYLLEKFDFIEPKPNDDDPKKRDSGFWRMTEKGRRFALRQTRAPRHVYIFDNKRIRFSDESVDINDCLGDAYDYEELMRPTGIALGAKVS